MCWLRQHVRSLGCGAPLTPAEIVPYLSFYRVPEQEALPVKLDTIRRQVLARTFTRELTDRYGA